MLIEELAAEVHANALDHGWWDEKRSIEEVIALIHSEWSEALEEARAGRPLVYGLIVEGDDARTPISTEDYDEIRNRGLKPEGVAVELIDGVIRIFDLFGSAGVTCADPHTGAPSEFEGLWGDASLEDEVPERVGDLICALHAGTSAVFDDDNDGSALPLLAVMSMALMWIHRQGLDPLELLLMKHEYNIGRPYKHGKQF